MHNFPLKTLFRFNDVQIEQMTTNAVNLTDTRVQNVAKYLPGGNRLTSIELVRRFNGNWPNKKDTSITISLCETVKWTWHLCPGIMPIRRIELYVGDHADARIVYENGERSFTDHAGKPADPTSREWAQAYHNPRSRLHWQHIELANIPVGNTLCRQNAAMLPWGSSPSLIVFHHESKDRWYVVCYRKHSGQAFYGACPIDSNDNIW